MGYSIELLALTILVLCCFYFSRKYKRIPGPCPFPILGNISQTNKQTKIQTNFQLFQQYGEIFKVKLGALIIYYINDGQLATKLFNDYADKIKGRVHFPIFELLQVNNRGAIHIDMNDTWKAANTFIHNISNQKIEDIVRASEEINKNSFLNLDQLKEWNPTNYSENTIKKIFIKFIYGRVNIDQNLENDICKVIDDFEYFVQNIQPHELFPSISYPRDYQQKITDYLALSSTIYDKLLALHKENLATKETNDILDLVVEKESDKLETKALVCNIISAAITNISNTCSWFIAYITKYPEVQKKIHEEFDKVVGKERLPQFSDYEQLKYFNATLNEVMRIRPVANELFFHTVTEDFECDGYFFARNTQFNLNIYNINHNPKYWKDADTFNPDRFLN